MTQTPLTELAKNGDPNAIAMLLGRPLQSQKVTVKVDWQERQLNIRFFGTELPSQEQLMTFARQGLQAIGIEKIQTVRVLGYKAGEPLPAWSQYLSLTALGIAAEPTPVGNGATTVLITPVAPTVLMPPSAPQPDRFLVCGLGSLGQYCVFNLKRFALRESEIHVTAIDRVMPDEWEVQNLPDLLLEPPIIGDCRDDDVLLKAGILECRAVLLATSNESVNIETALAARRLNPKIRIVVRSCRQNLNQLLKQQLGDFVAFEPTELPAPAFALAGLREGILGFFNIGDCRFQVVEQRVDLRDHRFDGFLAWMLHKKTHRLISYMAADCRTALTRAFYQWNSETKVNAGDTIAYVEVIEQFAHRTELEETTTAWQDLQEILQRGVKRNLAQFRQWLGAQRLRQVIAIAFLLALFLWVSGAILLKTTLDLSWQKAISSAFVLLLGGYGDIFGGLEEERIPGWVQLWCGLITLTSLATVLGVLGLITDGLLSSRFEFLRKRPPIPKQGHVVIVGFGRLGQRVAAMLREFRQPIVAITEHIENSNMLTKVPLVVGNLISELGKVNISTAKSVIVLTDDQILNLEIALMAQNEARQADRDLGLVIRAYDQRFRDNVNNLLPDAKALAAYELSAEAFAGAAFGENILGLFRLNNQTILVTEYQIIEDDTLVGKSLFQIAYGYGVVPVFHQRANQPFLTSDDLSDSVLPSDDRLLHPDDRLVILASINGLRRIEHGDLAPPRRWRLDAQKPLNSSFLLYCGNDLARISGCHLDEARAFMNNLPGTMELLMYDYQACRLMQELCRQLPIMLKPIA
ncbi:MAG: potassium transporter TrkA [Cyanobacteria bacterium CRU_2_1]|nr:potassium transporter TrkA [Cyanobacteria bacterium RU_5_0]NJR58440.1 potassium transporter TrkA [Cyanobacteria bacterium CRU_2_1]